MIDLRDYQLDALAALRRSIGSGHRSPMLQAPTGSGKTKLSAAIIESARTKSKRVAFTVPALSLIDQTVQLFWDEGIRDVGVIQADHVLTDWSKPVQICSVDTLARQGFPQTDIVIVDEAHRVSQTITKWMSETKIPFIGLSATPWARGLGRLYDDLIVVTTTKQLIDQGYLSPFKVFAPAHPDLSQVKIVAGDYHEGQLSDTMSKPEIIADVVKTWLRLGEGRPTICFAVDRAHARLLQDQFADAGVPAAYQDANTTLGEREIIRKQFHDGRVKVVCSVGTMIVGIDWDVRCIIWARPTKSEMLYCLDSETEILTSHGWRGRGEVSVGDVSASMVDIKTGAGCWSRVLSVIDREMTADESWIEYDAPRANFRVTDHHRMIFSSGGVYGERPFSVRPAEEMLGRNDCTFMPTAVQINQPGMPLTDAELYFIGMMLTDGTWTSTSGCISQSERYPEIIERIEGCLKACGIGYARRKVPPPPPGAAVQERFPRWRFDFSFGKPRAHGNLGRGPVKTKRFSERVPGVRGFGHLAPFMDKDISPALFSLSRTQFEILLLGLFDGDGFKLRGDYVTWTPRSMSICSGRKSFVDRLQALGAINGHTANIRKEQSISRKNPLYVITLTPKAWRSVGGYASGTHSRPQILRRSATNERVWCVETEAGTIITRRRGKVTVMGNCQGTGRGLRTADGKANCVILDHADNALRLGLVTDIHHDTLDGHKHSLSKPNKTPSPKECPQCSCLRPPRASECPNCGFVVVAQPNVLQVDGELAEFKREGGSCKVSKARKTVSISGTEVPLAEFYGALKSYAREKGWKIGWCANKYREAVGVWPNAYRDAAECAMPDCVKSWIKSRNIAYAKRRDALPKTPPAHDRIEEDRQIEAHIAQHGVTKISEDEEVMRILRGEA